MIRLILGVAMLTIAAIPTSAQAPTNGEIRRIDAAAGKVTLRHEPIPHLDMDSMTMVFRVRDPALLAGVKVGDKVVFTADRVDGAITVTSLRKHE